MIFVNQRIYIAILMVNAVLPFCEQFQLHYTNGSLNPSQMLG